MKKHLRTFSVCLLFFTGLTLSAQSWQWLKASVASDSKMLGADIDKNGNTWSFGGFTTSIKYDTTTLSCGNKCNYLAKHDAQGKLNLLLPIHKMFNVLRNDNAGNLYLASNSNGNDPKPFIGSDTLIDPTTPTNYLLLAKVNSAGQILWSIHYKQTSNVNITTNDMFTDASGNAYLLIQYNWDVILKDSTYALGGPWALMKINASGKVVYFKKLPNNAANIYGAVDKNGGVVLTGFAGGSSKTITIDAQTATNTNAGYKPSTYDIFLAKLDANATAQWVKLTNNSLTVAIPTLSGPNGVSLDSKNNIYMYGDYNSQIIFGNDTLSCVVTDQYSTNPFIVKYTSTGAQKWAYTSTGATKPGMQFLNVKVSKDDKLYFYGAKPGRSAYINKFYFPRLTSSNSADRWIGCFDTTMTNVWYRYISNGETNNQSPGFGVSDLNDVYVASGSNGALKLGSVDTTILAGYGTFVQYKNFTASGAGFGATFAYIAKYANDTLTTKLNSVTSLEGVRIYPNPATNYISVENTNGKNAQVSIYSIDGRFVKGVSIQNQLTDIGIAELSRGLYFIVVQTSEGKLTEKIVIQ